MRHTDTLYITILTDPIPYGKSFLPQIFKKIAISLRYYFSFIIARKIPFYIWRLTIIGGVLPIIQETYSGRP
jgi:hypothetical protein